MTSGRCQDKACVGMSRHVCGIWVLCVMTEPNTFSGLVCGAYPQVVSWGWKAPWNARNAPQCKQLHGNQMWAPRLFVIDDVLTLHFVFMFPKGFAFRISSYKGQMTPSSQYVSCCPKWHPCATFFPLSPYHAVSLTCAMSMSHSASPCISPPPDWQPMMWSRSGKIHNVKCHIMMRGGKNKAWKC